MLHYTFEHVHPHHVSMTMTYAFGIISTAVALGGIFVAYLTYMRGSISARALSEKYQGAYQFLLNKWYLDELYDAVIVRPLKAFSTFLWKIVDVGIIDGAVNGVAYGIGAVSQRLRHVQTGLVANYALAIALGMVILLGVVLAGFSNLFQ
jgi:NADH-quinone oxidoreductase subunit L